MSTKIVSGSSCTTAQTSMGSKMPPMQAPGRPQMQPLTAKDQIYQKVLGKFWVQRHGAFDQRLGWTEAGTWENYVPRGLDNLTGLKHILDSMCVSFVFWHMLVMFAPAVVSSKFSCSQVGWCCWDAMFSWMLCFPFFLVHPTFFDCIPQLGFTSKTFWQDRMQCCGLLFCPDASPGMRQISSKSHESMMESWLHCIIFHSNPWKNIFKNKWNP